MENESNNGGVSMPRLYLLAAILFVPVAIYVLKQLGLEESELRRTAGFLFVFAIGLGVFFAVVGWLFLRYFEFQEKKYFKFLENQLAKRNARIQENQIVFSHKSLEIAVSQSSVFLGEGTADVYVLKASPFTRKDFQLKIIKVWIKLYSFICDNARLILVGSLSNIFSIL